MRALLNFRFLPALVLGLVVSVGLFLLMHNLISTNQQANVNAQQITLVNFVQVQHNQQVQTKNYNRPPPPPPPKKPPPQQQIQQSSNVSQHVQKLPVNVKFNANSIGGSGVYIGNPNGGSNRGSYAPLTPMYRTRPMYPPRAQYEGVQGTVTTCFTVEPDGSVSNPHVTQASSPQVRQMLANAALQTIRQWKFFPQKENGKPIATKGVCQNIKFRIRGNGNGG